MASVNRRQARAELLLSLQKFPPLRSYTLRDLEKGPFSRYSQAFATIFSAIGHPDLSHQLQLYEADNARQRERGVAVDRPLGREIFVRQFNTLVADQLEQLGYPEGFVAHPTAAEVELALSYLVTKVSKRQASRAGTSATQRSSRTGMKTSVPSSARSSGKPVNTTIKGSRVTSAQVTSAKDVYASDARPPWVGVMDDGTSVGQDEEGEEEIVVPKKTTRRPGSVKGKDGSRTGAKARSETAKSTTAPTASSKARASARAKGSSVAMDTAATSSGGQSGLAAKFAELTETHNEVLNTTLADSVDPRRVQLLRAQNIQLERQVAMLRSQLDAQARWRFDMEGLLAQAMDTFGSDPGLQKKGALLAQRLNKIHHDADSAITNALESPYTVRAFRRYDGEENRAASKGVARTKVAKRRQADGSLSHVSESERVYILRDLETRLAQLVPSLFALNANLDIVLPKSLHPQLKTRVAAQVQQVSNEVRAVAHDLASSHLLRPAVTRIANQARKSLGADPTPPVPVAQTFLSALPPFTERRDEGERKIQEILNAFATTVVRVAACEQELRAASQQSGAGEEMVKLAVAGCDEWVRGRERELVALLKTLRDLLESFQDYQDESPEYVAAALREFIDLFRDSVPTLMGQISRIASTLGGDDTPSVRALSHAVYESVGDLDDSFE